MKALQVVTFTGTQSGMTDAQKSMVRNLVEEFEAEDGMTDVHHGDCVGADAEFHEIVLEATKAHIHIHPGFDRWGKSPKRAYCEGPIGRITMHEPKAYLARNIDMVAVCNGLIATPKQDLDVTRSGTWSTIRKAKRYGRPRYVVLTTGGVWDHEEE